MKSVVVSTLRQALRATGVSNPITFECMSYNRALAAYGSDKPDLRIPALLQPLPPSLHAAAAVRKAVALRLPRLAPVVSSSRLKRLLREIRSDVTVLRAGDGGSADA